MGALPKYRLVRKPPQGHDRSPVGRDAAPSLETVANLAHELRTPIQVLLGYVEMLREEIADGEQQRDIVERMNCNIHDLAETVENVMEFAQDSVGQGAALEENVAVAELLDEIAPMLEAANREKRLAIRIDLDAAPAVIRTRRHALHSIIANLASNAVKFTKAGSVSIALERARLDGSDAVKLIVKDSGPGIPSELVERVFQPMVQLSASNTRQHRGLGLGLTVVHRNVRAVGGSIRVNSEPGRGSVVTIVIPCALPDRV